MPRYALEIIDRKLRELTKVNRPFGGKLILLGGNFCQTLPVIKNASRSQQISLAIKSCPQWKYFVHFWLNVNMRANANAQEFADELRQIGLGESNGKGDLKDYWQPPEKLLVKDSLIEHIFGNLIREKRFDLFGTTAILASLNETVNEYNEKILETMQGEETVYHSVDSMSDDDHNIVMPENLNNMNSASLPPHMLRLKTNCTVMICRNLNVSEGLCNGTRLQVLDMARNLLKCRILTGDKADQIVYIPRITVSDNQSFPFTVFRHQFPVKLAMAMTIHKAQGQTFERIGIALKTEMFVHGQLYVALSRAKCWENIKLQLAEESESTFVKNVVYKEILTSRDDNQDDEDEPMDDQ
jgi:hypothetical protein